MDALNSPIKISYKINEACHALGIGRSLLYELMKKGEIKSFRIGGCRLIAHDDLMAFFNTQRQNSDCKGA